jgi:hypothetical protein
VVRSTRMLRDGCRHVHELDATASGNTGSRRFRGFLPSFDGPPALTSLWEARGFPGGL